MSRDPRDWQKDMNVAQSVKEYGFNDGLPSGELPDIAIYWMNIARFWEDQYNTASEVGDETTRQRNLEEERADKAEEREQKLKESMEWAVEESGWGDAENAIEKITGCLKDTLSTLYPLDKEEANETDHM